jgi:hypothetical protein
MKDFLRGSEMRHFCGLGGPGELENYLERCGPPFVDGFKAPRARSDPQTDPLRFLQKSFILSFRPKRSYAQFEGFGMEAFNIRGVPFVTCPCNVVLCWFVISLQIVCFL